MDVPSRSEPYENYRSEIVTEPVSLGVVHIKLTNGVDLVAEYATSDRFHHLINYPLAISESYDSNGSLVRMQLVKYLPFTANGWFAISKEHVISLTAIEPEFVEYYYRSRKMQDAINFVELKTRVKAANKEMGQYSKDITFKGPSEFDKAVVEAYRKDPSRIVLSSLIH